MKRREFITLLGGAATWPLTVGAQQTERMRRIGVLMTASVDDPDQRDGVAAFVQTLQQLGWTEGRNVQIETRWAGGEASAIRRHANELVALAPDVVAAAGNAVMGPNGGLILTASARAVVHRDLIIALAARYRLPAVYYRRHFVDSGGLISYGHDFIHQFRSAASYVDRILRGEKPADLPVQAPTKYELVVNLRTARTLGITVPDPLLAGATEVIEYVQPCCTCSRQNLAHP